MLFQGLGSIMRTGGSIPALRAQPGGNDPLVDLYHGNKWQAQYLPYTSNNTFTAQCYCLVFEGLLSCFCIHFYTQEVLYRYK